MKSRSEAKAESAKVPPAVESSPSVEEPFKFESANASKKKSMRADLRKIVETIFIVDVHEKWKRLRAELEVGLKRSEHGTLQKALDRAERRAHEAHLLYLTAKVERDRWERENDLIFGAMWSEATAALQKEKEGGTRAKQITDADVRLRVATLHPDQYEAQENERSRVKATIDALEDLSTQWKSRCRSLQTMLGKLRD